MIDAENFTCRNNTVSESSHLPLEVLQNWFVVNITCNAVGTVFALLLLVAIFSGTRFHKSGAQLLIAHLILVDLAICLIHSPLNAITTFVGTMETVSATERACSYTHFAFMATMYSGQWTSAFLAFNRFIATYFPHSYKSFFVGSVHLNMIFVAWAIGVLMNIPFFFGVGGTYGSVPPWNGCGIRPDENSSIYTLTVGAGLYGPLVLGFGFYLIIFIRAIVHHFQPSRVYTTSTCPDRRRTAKRKRLLVAKMLFLSSLTVCLFYLPHAVYGSSYYEVISCNPELQLWLHELFYLGYAVNPVSKVLIGTLHELNSAEKMYNSAKLTKSTDKNSPCKLKLVTTSQF